MSRGRDLEKTESPDALAPTHESGPQSTERAASTDPSDPISGRLLSSRGQASGWERSTEQRRDKSIEIATKITGCANPKLPPSSKLENLELFARKTLSSFNTTGIATMRKQTSGPSPRKVSSRNVHCVVPQSQANYSLSRAGARASSSTASQKTHTFGKPSIRAL